MFERSVVQSSKPSQVSTEWDVPGQPKTHNQPTNSQNDIFTVMITLAIMWLDFKIINKSTIPCSRTHSQNPIIFIVISLLSSTSVNAKENGLFSLLLADSLRRLFCCRGRGETMTGSVRTGLVRPESASSELTDAPWSLLWGRTSKQPEQPVICVELQGMHTDIWPTLTHQPMNRPARGHQRHNKQTWNTGRLYNNRTVLDIFKFKQS